jgi:long-chain acyl-CoA synthetase
MLYSSGTTGRPKGILRPLPDEPAVQPLPLFGFLQAVARPEGMVYLSPAPLYHSAPLAHLALTLRNGGTVVIMEHFDPEQYLALVERTGHHTQLVPTMFSRMLKLPADVRARYDLSSLEIAVHAAAPCPVQVKEQMIAWWGPIIHEYYGATEGLGFTACDTPNGWRTAAAWAACCWATCTSWTTNMQPVPKGTPGEIWFKTANALRVLQRPGAHRQLTRSADGSMSTVGDVGYVDDDGFLYLTDRSSFMIISGGVNIYPQECENLLITHPQVADAAVFGVPNEDLGEEVKAVVQLMPGRWLKAALTVLGLVLATWLYRVPSRDRP